MLPRFLASIALPIALSVQAPLTNRDESFEINARTSNGTRPTSQAVPISKIDNAILYRLPLMNIDLDGAPNAYHPPVPEHPHGKGPGLGLDDLRNASKNLDDGPNAKWVGIVTDSDGKPLIQKDGPFAGFYISQTTLQDPTFPVSDARRYVDATKIPYVVLNPILRKKAGLDVGDLAVVVLHPQEPKVAFGIVADIGPANDLGECSQALAAALGASGGVEHSDLVYIFFATPTKRRVRTPDQIRSEAQFLFEAWGGISRVQGFRKPPVI